MAKSLKVTLVKSPVCQVKEDQTKTAKALGLNKIGDSKVHPDNESVRGMIFKIKHLLKVEEEK